MSAAPSVKSSSRRKIRTAIAKLAIPAKLKAPPPSINVLASVCISLTSREGLYGSGEGSKMSPKLVSAKTASVISPVTRSPSLPQPIPPPSNTMPAALSAAPLRLFIALIYPTKIRKRQEAWDDSNPSVRSTRSLRYTGVVTKDDIILYDKQTDHAHYRVVETIYDGRPARILFGDDMSSQAGIATDGEPELLFDYIQRLYELAKSVAPRRVLLIGGGAFTLPTAILGLPSVEHVDVVELDEELETIARTYFGLPEDDRLQVINGDGRDFIEQNNGGYDLIIVDAFTGYEIPKHLITVEAAADYCENLAGHGVLAINFISSYSRWRVHLANRLLATFQAVFETVDVYPASEKTPFLPTDRNLILIAYDHEQRDFDSLTPELLDPLQTDKKQIIHDA